MDLSKLSNDHLIFVLYNLKNGKKEINITSTKERFEFLIECWKISNFLELNELEKDFMNQIRNIFKNEKKWNQWIDWSDFNDKDELNDNNLFLSFQEFLKIKMNNKK